jgi:long-chain fatty acid transport protein
MTPTLRRILLPALVMALAAGPLSATDGHFLHGVGAVNSAMGGAGVAAPSSLLGTFYLNPAGLMAFDGTRMEFGFEMFKADRSLASDLPGFASGATRSKSDWSPIPAMGISTRLSNDKVVVGVGALGIGGFGVDYATSATNPILTPQPGGFGQIYSNYQFLKISPSVAYAPSPRLWIGGSLNVDWASLAVNPMPITAPDYDPTTGTAYYPSAMASDGAFGVGFQLGVLVKPVDLLAIGASYSSPQWFNSFNFNSRVSNPNLATFGTNRSISFRLDVPAVYALGVALTPLPNLTLAADGRYITYASTRGFDQAGFNADGSVKGFGWKNIHVLAVGGEFRPVNGLALRAGYNRSDNPITEAQSFFNTPAPAIVQTHLTAGAGIKLTRRMELSAAYYHVIKNTLTGPIPNPAVPAGSTVTSSMSEDALLMQFTLTSK